MQGLTRAEKLDQVRETILQIFEWSPATFDFVPSKDSSDLRAAASLGRTLALDPAGLLLESARREDESARLDAAFDDSLGTSAGVRRGFLEGTLEGVGLAAVLQTLRAEQLSGTLTIQGVGEKHVYFSQGDAFLFRRNDTDHSSLAEFFGESWDDEMSFVQLEGASGSVHEDELPDEEATALKEAFFDTLFWGGAQFEFLLGVLPESFEDPGENATRIALNSDRFLLEAVQRLAEWDELRDSVGGSNAVFQFTTPDAKLEAVQTFGPPELLTLVDGRQTLGELARRSGRELLEVGRVLRDLLTLDLIERTEDAGEAEPESAPASGPEAEPASDPS